MFKATEIIYLFTGTLKTAFVEENGGRTIVNTLKTGQVTFFPRGLIHEQVIHFYFKYLVPKFKIFFVFCSKT